jgi:hypothetical protein
MQVLQNYGRECERRRTTQPKIERKKQKRGGGNRQRDRWWMREEGIPMVLEGLESSGAVDRGGGVAQLEVAYG